MQNTVSIRWLLARMYEPDLVIADCRFWLNDPAAGRQKYEEAHIPRAVFLDLEQDLSAPVTTHGGRHPLPEPEEIARVFGRVGLSQDDRIVIYDDNNGMNASRLWWMLTYLGHTQVYILEQDFTAWQQAGFPVTDEQPVVIPKTFVAHPQPDMIVDVDYVREVSKKAVSAMVETAGPQVLIDSRDRNRYLGLEEPMDKKAGHIPGALNYFWKDVLNDNGSLKSSEELAQHFAGLDQDAEIIVYCGSGVSACPNVLALRQAGYENVKLYPGSWSDWISYEDNSVATGEEV
ncbi:sulfurtransferase [Paenibacillus sp. FSL K6-1230]|uniref:sulfurtransferase n=1 Tax=Paenibacillus sp. FSL K6-1230 TaxID=2921603 RepID=UPI0030F59B42